MIKARPNGWVPTCRGDWRENEYSKDISPAREAFVGKKRTVFGYADAVIRFARKTRQVGRRVVTVAVSWLPSWSWVLAVTVVVEADEPIVFR